MSGERSASEKAAWQRMAKWSSPWGGRHSMPQAGEKFVGDLDVARLHPVGNGLGRIFGERRLKHDQRQNRHQAQATLQIKPRHG